MSKLALKNECKELKAVATELKVIPAQNSDPFPITIYVKIPQPENAEMYDIYDLIVRFLVDSFDSPTLKVVVDQLENQLPRELSNSIGELIQKQWTLLYRKGNQTEFKSWYLVEMFKWIQLRFVNLVSSVPSCLEMYLGDSSTGATIRRYAVVQPTVEEEEEEEEEETEEAEEEDVEEEEEEDEEAAAYWRAQKEADMQAILAEREREAEARRREAELDPNGNIKMPKVSKKELEAQKAAKNKQGVRMRKTGPKRKKYVPPEEQKKS